MENNEKLLEAAVMIKENCEKTGSGKLCCFAFNGVCQGVDDCILSTDGGAPMFWPIDRESESRWTPADKALAAGLKANGYNSVTRMHGSETVLVMGRSQTALELGKGVFENLQLGEIVNLDDIIGEGRK